jgi:primosomal protein N' (replication factor Y)
MHQTFTYAVAKGAAPPALGSRVLVPFQRRERIGWVVEHGDAVAAGSRRLRPILDALDDEPTATPELLSLARWMADYYVAPLGIVLSTIHPSVLVDVSRDLIGLERRVDDVVLAGLPPRARRVAEALQRRAGAVQVATLRGSLGLGSIWPEIRLLKSAGILEHETLPPRPPPVKTRRMVELVRDLPTLELREEVFGRAHRQREAYDVLQAAGGADELARLTGESGFSRSVISGLEEKGVARTVDREVERDPFADIGPTGVEPPPLTREQAVAVGRLEAGMEDPDRRPFLLHGVTGSGKTRVYIELLERVLARGQGAIVLVPEISLTPQTVKRFRGRFGDRVAVLHSALSDGERYDAWRQLRRGERVVAVGARSALFAPVRNLGAVVVDEEHDSSYKQSESPRYHARDLAVVRAAAEGAVCVLGSATPSLESWANAESGKYDRLSLPVRVGDRPMPPVELVDLKEVWKKGGGEETRSEAGPIFSPRLVAAVEARLEREEQTILLLNRRGYSSFVQCRECGDVRRCVDCSISLTYHRVRRRIVCHHCRHEEPVPERCERCGADDLGFRGLGTEQVERVVADTFPSARIARMDVDTTSGKWAHHEILGRVERGEIDILLGTQMIAKGLDFPRVTLVGVVNADVGIHLPDFRASERTFQLISQVAGRAGRGPLGGEVLIQTAMPDHYALLAAKAHDYAGFAERELRERKVPPYPPHSRLANVVISSPDPDLAADTATAAVAGVDRWIGMHPRAGVVRVGPAPAPIERLHGRWRWHFLLRSGSVRGLGAICRSFITGFEPPSGDVRISLDRDPVALL